MGKKTEDNVLERARRIIESGTIEPSQVDCIRRAAISLRENGGDLELGDERIVRAACGIFGKDFDQPPPPPSPFDAKIAELEAEIAKDLAAYEVARQCTWDSCCELGGASVLLGGKLTVTTGLPRRQLSGADERRLTQICEVAAADELRLRDQVEESCALRREQIKLLSDAAHAWRQEQEAK